VALRKRRLSKNTDTNNDQTHYRLPIVRPKAGERAPPIKTQARGATILPNFVGLIFQVHNGKIYNDVKVTEEMVGHKLGEFSA
jgi:ribosomal protein S19